MYTWKNNGYETSHERRTRSNGPTHQRRMRLRLEQQDLEDISGQIPQHMYARLTTLRPKRFSAKRQLFD